MHALTCEPMSVLLCMCKCINVVTPLPDLFPYSGINESLNAFLFCPNVAMFFFLIFSYTFSIVLHMDYIIYGKVCLCLYKGVQACLCMCACVCVHVSMWVGGVYVCVSTFVSFA